MDEVLSDVDNPDVSPVFYHEVKDSPGVCVDCADGFFDWSPSRLAVKVGEVDSSEDDLNHSAV